MGKFGIVFESEAEGLTFILGEDISEDEFVALPVDGDAFLLRRAGKVILVDGGSETEELAACLNHLAPDVRHIDIAVCTHADSDHAGGFRKLLRKPDSAKKFTEWDGKISQFWLPGRWAEAVRELLTSAEGFMDGLVDELDRFASGLPKDLISKLESLDPELAGEVIGFELPRRLGHPGLLDSDALLDHEELSPSERDAMPEKRERDDAERDPRKEPRGRRPPRRADADSDDEDYADAEGVKDAEWFEKLKKNKEIILKKAPAFRRAAKAARTKIDEKVESGKVHLIVGKAWLKFIDTAENIHDIALQAIEHDVTVIWFDFDAFKNGAAAGGGIRGLLEPVNATSRHRSLGAVVMRSHLLHLSEVNRESLVFYSPESEYSYGVLFTADSPLRKGRLPHGSFFSRFGRSSADATVATVPHHGAKSNNVAYGVLNAWTNVVMWVRSGGQPRHPDGSILAEPSTRRACTNCPKKKHRYQMVRIFLGTRLICPPPIWRGHQCDCTYEPDSGKTGA